MASATVELNHSGEGLFANPWPFLFAGLGAVVLALMAYQAFGYCLFPLIVAGLILSGGGIAIRPSSPVVLGLAALTGAFACLGLSPRWDTMHLLFSVLTVVAFAAGLLMLLPRVLRRIIVSVLLVLHFGGMATAATAIDPGPWLSSVVWTYFYHPYLEFMYFMNAYHFYSPDPGPGQLVWFYVKYDDGSHQWFRVPHHGDNPLLLEYQRRLSLAESINQVLPPSPVDPGLVKARVKAGQRDGIPPHPLLDAPAQRREPKPYSKRMLSSYAEHIAHALRHPTDPSHKVTSVKIYRLQHNIPLPRELAEGDDPAAGWFYLPYYLGEYSPQGELMDPDSPYLYWLIPVLKRENPPLGAQGGQSIEDEDSPFLEHYLARHAQLAGPPSPAPIESLVPLADK